MRVVVAPDKFKESLSAAAVAAALAAGVRDVVPEADCVTVPMADGGDGTVEAFVESGTRSELRTGNGFRNTALVKVKMALLAPIPSASDSSATSVNPGLFASVRKAYLKSCQTDPMIGYYDADRGPRSRSGDGRRFCKLYAPIRRPEPSKNTGTVYFA